MNFIRTYPGCFASTAELSVDGERQSVEVSIGQLGSGGWDITFRVMSVRLMNKVLPTKKECLEFAKHCERMGLWFDPLKSEWYVSRKRKAGKGKVHNER